MLDCAVHNNFHEGQAVTSGFSETGAIWIFSSSTTLIEESDFFNNEGDASSFSVASESGWSHSQRR